MSLGFKKLPVAFRSPLNGTPQNIELPGGRWVMSLTLQPFSSLLAGDVEALLNYLAGGVNTVSCWHFSRPVPRGTIAGSPTVDGGITRGATTLPVATVAGYTVKAGDMLGSAGQLFMAQADATADGNGDLSVPLVNKARASIANATAIVWSRPKATFACFADINPVAHVAMLQEGAALELEEVW